MGLTRFGYLTEIEELLDNACSELPPDEFEKLKSDVKETIENYES